MPEHLRSVLVFLIGACIGSFLNVCIWRIPHGKSIVSPPSACPGCGHPLKWWENIPIVSFVALRARCSKCGMHISYRYPAVELLTALLGLGLFVKFGMSWTLLAYAVFSAALLVITFIDLDHQIIPDIISLPGIVAGFLASFLILDVSWLDSLIGIALGGGILYLVAWTYYLISKREGMGGGDIKLLAMIGSFLGWQAVPLVIFVSAASGSIVGLAYMALSGRGRHTPVPYGPFLAMGALIHLFWGNDIVAWYVHLLSG